MSINRVGNQLIDWGDITLINQAGLGWIWGRQGAMAIADGHMSKKNLGTCSNSCGQPCFSGMSQHGKKQLAITCFSSKKC